MSPTIIPTISPDQFAARIADLFPRGWCGDDAKMPGGLVYNVFYSAAQQLQVVLEEIRYAANAQRMQTETDPELDLASLDFLGPRLPRPAGMTDAEYAALIIAEIFHTAATRPALREAITRLTGVVPRMLEPWSIFDTGVWSRNTYWNVDTLDNPGRWGNGGYRYQGYIETVPAALPAIGANNPIYGWSSGPLGPYWNVPGYFFGIIDANPGRSIYDLVNRIRAYGTTVWIKLLTTVPAGTPVVPGPAQTLVALPVGATQISLSWLAPSTGTAPFVYQVLSRVAGSLTWVSGVTTSLTAVALTGLLGETTYEFMILTRNSVGSSNSLVATAQTTRIAPSPVQNLVSTLAQATAVTLTWDAPINGTPPFTYTIQYRVTGTLPWSTFAVSDGTTGVTVIGLRPNTTYDFEVIASNV